MKRVLWGQVVGLSAVQGSIALTWVIYNLYLGQLLVHLGFPKPLATTLLILESILAAGIEPLMGSLSDECQRWMGTRFPLIAAGIVLSAACFIGIPAFLVFGQGSLPWILPTLMVAWALAMTVFRSPALSLLGRYAFSSKLPQAASILTLVGGLAGAMGPLASSFILSLGPVVTFGIGSIVLLLAATVLQLVNPNRSIQPEVAEVGAMISVRSAIAKLALVFGVGFGVSLGFRLMMQVFPRILRAHLQVANLGLILGCIFLALALTAIPSGTLASRWLPHRAMVYGLGAMGVLMLGMLVCWNVWMSIGEAISLGVAFSFVSNGTIPFALSMVPPDKAGLGTGMYFSGGAVASSLFAAVFSSDSLPTGLGVLLAAASFLLAGWGVLRSSSLGDRGTLPQENHL